MTTFSSGRLLVVAPHQHIPSNMSKKLLAVAGGSLAALVAFGLIFAQILSDDFDSGQKLELACKWLDDGRWDLAAKMAEDLEPAVDLESDSRWHYVTGVALLMKVADDIDSAANRRILLEATEHLNKCRELGFPIGLNGRGTYFLGVCYFHTYKWDEAIEALEGSLKEYPQSRSQALHMIFRSQLNKPAPDIAAAKATLARWELIPGKSDQELAQVHLAHAQLGYKEANYDDSLKWIAKISPKLGETFDGQNLFAMCHLKMAEKLKDPTERSNYLVPTHNLLKRQIFQAETPANARRQSSYLFGKTLRLQGQLVPSTAAFSIVRQQSPNSAESIAASLEEAEVLMELNESDEVLSITRQMLKAIEDIQLYNDYWLPLEELRNRLVSIGDELRQNSDYERAIELSGQLALAFPPAYALRLQADTYVDWADTLHQGASAEATLFIPEALTLYNKAGDAYERLSSVELRSENYLDIVWKSAENYQAANQIEAANRMLATYLQYETRARQPRGLIAIGKNYVNRGDWQSSIDPLQRCLDHYGNSPSCYEARHLLAKACSELNNLDRAVELLSTNLWDYDLTPDSPIWRDSLTDLGYLTHQRGSQLLSKLKVNPPKDWNTYSAELQSSLDDLEHAIEHLGEAADRYANDPRRNFTRYLLADSYRMAADIPKTIAASDPSLLDSARRQQMQRWRKLMENSAAEFHSLVTDIQASKNVDSLAPDILKNSYFGEADVLSALGQYDRAIQAYKSAASYYVNQPEALEALAQVAMCHRKLGRESEAQKALRQAEQVLKRIPAELDGRFVSSTRGDRSHWQDLLGWMSQGYH